MIIEYLLMIIGSKYLRIVIYWLLDRYVILDIIESLTELFIDWFDYLVGRFDQWLEFSFDGDLLY